MNRRCAGIKRSLDVLVVDDDPLIGLMLQGGLDADRFSVSVADSGAQAIAMCEASTFDFAVVDYRMPGRSGLDVAGVLRNWRIPYVMLSAFADSRIEQRAAQQGALGYLVKPVTPRQVELAIATGLSRATEIDNLSRAAEVSGIVGVAVGLVMSANNCSEKGALELLRQFCRPENKTLKDVSIVIKQIHEESLMQGGMEARGAAIRAFLEGTAGNRRTS
jgi:DNA-binding response OmpR family regulator